MDELLKKIINESDFSQRLDQLLKVTLHISLRHAHRILELNGLKKGKFIGPQEEIFLKLPEEKSLSENTFKVFAEEKDFIVFDKLKAAHMVAIKGKENGAIENEIRKLHPDYLLCQRLDFETLGLFLVAKNKSFHEKMREAFQNHEVHKFYLAELEKDFDLESPYFYESELDIKSHKPLRVKIGQGKFFSMEIERFKNSQVIVKTSYGYPHIVRAALSSLGFPLRFDKAYGAKEDSENFRLLAFKLEFLKFSFEKNI